MHFTPPYWPQVELNHLFIPPNVRSTLNRVVNNDVDYGWHQIALRNDGTAKAGEENNHRIEKVVNQFILKKGQQF